MGAQRGAIFKQAKSYTTTDPTAFPEFMRDWAAVERFRTQIELYVGRVAGSNPADPNKTLGRTPS
jgi:hypothetical protein